MTDLHNNQREQDSRRHKPITITIRVGSQWCRC